MKNILRLISILVVCISVGDCYVTHYCTAAGDPCPQQNSTCVSCCQGWEGPACSLDQDECSTALLPCKGFCTNTNGSFRCDCPDVTLLTSDYRCEDPCDTFACDELCFFNSTKSLNPYCGCGEGWRISSDNYTCVDVDECQTGDANCTLNSHCINTNGSYICACDDGFLGANGTCIDINECITSPCSHNCTNTPGDFYCSCPEGFTLDINGTSCVDSDECEDPSTCDVSNSVCRNTVGSYECDCYAGFTSSPDNKTCSDEDECQLGVVCVNSDCVNTPGTYECKCHTGYEFYNKTHCRDINECNDRVNRACQQSCTNTPGAFQCTCFPGWYGVNVTACVRESWNHCEHWCQLDIYNKTECTCACGKGYQLASDGTSCEDIDECSISSTCSPDQVCTNNEGGYTCDCYNGFEMDWSSGQCVDRNECDKPPLAAKCQHSCVNTEGSYECTCREGYVKVHFGECVNINECLTDNGGCEHECTDTEPGYHCSCNPGWLLANDRHNCTEILCSTRPILYSDCDQGYLCETANISCTEGNRLGASCSIRCNDDFILKDANATFCQENSKWSELEGTCICKSDIDLSLSTYTAYEAQVFSAILSVHHAVCQPEGVYQVKHCPIGGEGANCDWTNSSITVLSNGSMEFQLSKEETKIYLTSGNVTKQLNFKIISDGFPKIEKDLEVEVLLINTPSAPDCWPGPGDFQVVGTEPYEFQTVDRDVHEDAIDQVTCKVNNTLLQITNSSSPTSSFAYWSVAPKGGKSWEKTSNDSTMPLFIECYDTTGGMCHLEESITIKELLQLPYKVTLDPDSYDIAKDIKNAVLTTLKPTSEANKIVKDNHSYKMVNYKDIFKIDGLILKSIVETIPPAIYNISILCENDQDIDSSSYKSKIFHQQLTISVVAVERQGSTSLYIGVSLSSCFLIVVCICVAVYKQKRLKKRLTKREDTVILNPIYSKEFKGYYVYESDLKVHTDVILGRGNFGRVYMGDAKNTRLTVNKNAWMRVAVKEIYGKPESPEYQAAFAKEVKALTMFKHKHIISLAGIGVNAQNAEVYILMDYMNKGALKEFLVSCQKDDMDMEPYHYVYMAAQVADAMEHLESINCIHRDLAARNCLVDNNLFVKVGDLGYATAIQSKAGCLTEYYNVSGKAIPVRWTSPEVLMSCRYSIASDVWSFGVLFWEIITLGAEPYAGIDQNQVSEAVKAGQTLEVPEDKCCTDIRHLIQSCWIFEPLHRASFKQIFREINRIILEVYGFDYGAGGMTKEVKELQLGLV